MHAIRFHYRPVRYLLTRWAAARRPRIALSAIGCVSLDQVEPLPLPGPDWVRIAPTLSGICGSDLAAVTAHDSFTLEPFGAYPFTFGHENVGQVVEAGPASGWATGAPVVVNPMLACAQRGIEPICPACSRGEYGLCRNTTGGAIGTGPMIGYCPGTGGGWSASFVAHRSQLIAVEGLEPETAVLVDPLASALRPVLLQPPAPDDVVLVIGAGTIGALTVMCLRATGWAGEIAVVGRHDFQRDLAGKAGATRTFGSGKEAREWAASLPGARRYKPTLADEFVEGGPSLVYDTVGTAATIRSALSITREGGRVVLVGAAARVNADWTRLWYRQLTVAGIFAYGLAPYGGVRQDIYEVAVALLREHDFAGLGMVTHVYALEDYRAALGAALDKGGHRSIKVAFRPHV